MPRGYYVKDGQPTGSLDRVRVALRILREGYAHTLARDFGPLAMQAVLQRLTGCRPAEVCLIRPCNMDRSGKVWKFVPHSHKTAYCGKKRTIFIGPSGEELFLGRTGHAEDWLV